MIAREYKKSWKFLRECRNHVLAVVVLFFLAVLTGFLFPVFFVDFINKFIEEKILETAGMGFLQLLLFILQNNLLASCAGFLLGIILGVPSLFYALLNGYVLGFVAGKSVSAAGAGVLIRLLPHGIFELPALFISLGLGLKLGLFLFTRKNRKSFVDVFKRAVITFVLVIIPLLIIAAVIETGLIFLIK